jgi:hypothetical protein
MRVLVEPPGEPERGGEVEPERADGEAGIGRGEERTHHRPERREVLDRPERGHRRGVRPVRRQRKEERAKRGVHEAFE